MRTSFSRSTGLILIGIGFVATVLAGLLLAVGDLEAGTLATRGVLAFLLIAPVLLAGIYFYVRSDPPEVDIPETSDMLKQRELLDALREQRALAVPELAHQLEVDEARIQEYVYQLVQLEVLSGVADWEAGMLYAADAVQLRALQTCQKCGTAIDLRGRGVIRCAVCGTEYLLP
jgi:hypothetical protein